jgi:hypothetical protein
MASSRLPMPIDLPAHAAQALIAAYQKSKGGEAEEE